MDASFRWHDEQELDPGFRRDDDGEGFRRDDDSEGFRRDDECKQVRPNDEPHAFRKNKKEKSEGCHPMSMHGSFLTHANMRWLWAALALLFASLVAYAWHTPMGAPPNGGTWLGYTLGTIGALLILWLMWFGIRKRR